MKRIQVLHAVVFMMSEENPKEQEKPTTHRSPNITEATEKDWEDFFSVQEENIFDR